MFSGADLFQYSAVILFNITSQNIEKLWVLAIKILNYEIQKYVQDFFIFLLQRYTKFSLQSEYRNYHYLKKQDSSSARKLRL